MITYCMPVPMLRVRYIFKVVERDINVLMWGSRWQWKRVGIGLIDSHRRATQLLPVGVLRVAKVSESQNQ